MTKAGFLLREQYVARTLAEAARFSRTLMEELRSELTELKASIDTAKRVVSEAADFRRRDWRSNSGVDTARRSRLD